ncbi:MAG TPA: DUF389 domain-containing protein [Thermoleophilaceae bacterium]
MIHLRIVAPADMAEKALELLFAERSVLNVVTLPGAARKPKGDVILCDITPEDASVIIGDLRELGIPAVGSIAIEKIDSEISEAGKLAERHAPGLPSDAVVWEDVEARTSENVELSWNFIAFMVLAVLIAMAGIFLDSPILIIGAMVVGPEFGPLAGLCVALVHRRADTALRSFKALLVGFPVAITGGFLMSLAIKELALAPDGFAPDTREFTEFITHPDFFSFLVAFLAGMAGVLSLTSAKSGALVGVLISVTTIPAAANIGLACAYADWSEWRGAMGQLSVNLGMIVVAGVGTLYVQRRLYIRRRIRHLSDPERERAGLPLGRSLRSGGRAEP